MQQQQSHSVSPMGLMLPNSDMNELNVIHSAGMKIVVINDGMYLLTKEIHRWIEKIFKDVKLCSSTKTTW